jgi:hypothetical protein
MSDYVIIINDPVFYFEQNFGDWTLPPFSGNTSTQFGPINRASPYVRK